MFTQIVVGVGEHEGGRDAVALATKLLGADAHVVLTNVHCPDAPLYPGPAAAYARIERERAEARLAAVRDAFGLAAELSYIGSTSVGRGLHELAETRNADLLVVGSARRSLAGRVLMEDSTRDALECAPCAVAVAPAGYADDMGPMREIGVGFDGAPESARALALARSIAAGLRARLSALEVVSLPNYVLRDGSTPIDESIEEYLEEARSRIAALGGVEAHAVYGHAAEELTLYSASLDLLVVGSRGYGPFGRLIHGSTSQRLAHRARCPLLVLPRMAALDENLERLAEEQQKVAISV